MNEIAKKSPKSKGFSSETAAAINKRQQEKILRKYPTQIIKPGELPRPRDRIVNLA